MKETSNIKGVNEHGQTKSKYKDQFGEHYYYNLLFEIHGYVIDAPMEPRKLIPGKAYNYFVSKEGDNTYVGTFRVPRFSLHKVDRAARAFIRDLRKKK